MEIQRAKMGFSRVGLLSSNVFVNNYDVKRVKYQSSNEKMCMRMKFPKFKGCRKEIVLCKSENVDFEERSSPNEIRKEVGRCYELIQRLGRGVVYLGSSRMGPDHPHYSHVLELGQEVAELLNCTSWSGVGPGLMDAATRGALQAGKPVGGFKIARESAEWTASNFHPYLPSETYLTCRFFSARKHGLVDAAVRHSSSDRTAIIALPGGIGTLDEIFEILGLTQLERIGSKLPVPFLVMNYDSFYGKLFEFLDTCEELGTVSKGEISALWKVCNDNSEALAYLADFYNLPQNGKQHHQDNITSE